MVGPLKRYKRDPEGKGRGPGLYYHRGKGRYSKYSYRRDLKRISPTKKRKKRYGHTRDSRYYKRRGVRRGKI